MDKIATMSLELNNNIELFTKLKEFVNLCIQNKKYSFKSDEFTPETILIENEILVIEDNNIKINKYYAFSKAFFDVYKEKLHFVFSSDFLLTFKFLSEISKDLKGGGFQKVKPFLWEYSIYISNKLHDVSFINISDYLIQKNHDDYIFLNAYNSQLPYLNLDNNILIQSVINIVNHINKESESGVLNINYNSTLTTLSNITKSDHQKGFDLIKIAIEIETIDINIIACLVEGIYTLKNAESIELIENYIHHEKKLDGIFSGLARVDNISDIEAEKFLKYFEEFYSKNHRYKKPLILILFSILKAENLKNKIVFDDCIFDHLVNVIDDEDAVYLVLDRISFLEQYNSKRVNLLCLIIQKDFYSNKKYLRLIAQTFWYLKDVDCLEKVLSTLSDYKPFSNIASEFSDHFYDFDRAELDKMFLKFIVSNKASVRNLGVSFFNELNSHQSYHFHYDIQKLSPLEQYKMIVSITENYNEPKNTLPCLIPLLDSPSCTVRESLICKLEEYSENYGGHVIEVLRENLNEKNGHHNIILERVNKYMVEFYDKYVNIKDGIKELDPYFCQSKYIDLFNKNFQQKFSSMMDDANGKENSFLSMINSIQVAKGGGWKTGENKEVSKLHSIGHSFAMPRNHLIFPNKYDLEYAIATRTDWKDEDFKLITDLISNEQ